MTDNDMTGSEQNEISSGYLGQPDLGEREKEVLNDAVEKTGFKPLNRIGRSAWWRSTEIGALHYDGTYEGKRAVLKIQGVKPNISEIYMIAAFSGANKSRVIRPPHLYTSIPWDENERYEALVMEYIDGSKVIQTPTNQDQVRMFFELYREYRKNCLESPWVVKPKASVSQMIAGNFSKWIEIRRQMYQDNPLAKGDDSGLIDEAVKALEEEYKGVDAEFVHGHFSEVDLYQMGDQVILLSNLFWSWRPPLYDAVFGYHWFMYHLNTVEGITQDEVEKQRELWLSEIHSLPIAQGNNGKKLLNLALLERAAAGLNLDGLNSNPQRPISHYLMETTRSQIKMLLSEL